MLKIKGEEMKEYNVRVFSGSVESSKIIQNLTNKNLIGSGNNELYLRNLKTDKRGDANWSFTPYSLATDSPYQVYTFVLESPEDPYAPINVRNVLVSSSKTIFKSELTENSYQKNTDTIKVSLTSVHSLTGQNMQDEKLDIDRVLVKYAVSSDGKVIQSQISDNGNINDTTNLEGKYDLMLDKPEAGTYYFYVNSGAARYLVASFDIYSAEMLDALKSAVIPPLSISRRTTSTNDGLQLFIPKLDESSDHSRLFTYQGEGEKLKELSTIGVIELGGLVNLDLEDKPQTQTSYCYFYPADSQLHGGCQKLYHAR